MLSLLILMASQDSSDPVIRFEKYLREAKTFSANLEFTLTGVPAVGKGSFHFKRPDQMIFIMKWGRSDYSFSIGNKQIVAIERGTKRYREYGDVGRFFIPETDISSTPEYSLPMAFLTGSLRGMVPDGVQTKAVGKGTFEGIPVDITRAEYTTQSGKVIVTCKVDSAGRALEFDREMIGEGTSVHARTRVTGYRINIQLEDSIFNPVIPNGYVSQTLPPAAYPLNVGEKLSFAGWKPLSHGQDLGQLAAGKPVFLAVSDPSCEISKNAAKFVAELASLIKAKGVVAAAISLDPSSTQTPVFQALPNYVDPTSSLVSKLRAPGTPLFFLVTPKGVVSRVWFGYDPATAGEFKKDVLAWINKPANTSE